MKNKIKKLVAVLTLTALMLSLVACGANNTQKDGEVPTLVWYVPGDVQEDLPLVLEEVNKIVEPAIGAKIDLQFIAQASYTERIQMLMASQTEFDLMLTGYVNNFTNAYQKGGLMDITEFVEKDKELKNLLPDYAWKAASFNDSIYAVPNEQIWATCWAFAIRKDLADAYGYDVTKFKTMEDAYEFWDLVKEKNPEIIPLYMSFGEDPRHMGEYEVVSGNAAYDLKANKFVSLIDTDSIKIHAEYKKELLEKGYIRKDIATAQNETADYKAGRYATAFFVYKPGIELVKKLESGYDWYMIPISEPYTSRSSINATMTAVSATSKNAEKAVEFIKLINTNEDVYRLICHGIEGKHYEKVSDNMIKYLPDTGYNVSADWKFGNQFNAYPLEGQPEDVWQQTEELNDSATISPLIGFSFNPDPVQTELAQISTVDAKYPYIKGLVNVNDSTWNQLVKDYKQAGTDTILEEVKRQYDEYKKTVKE